MNQSSVSFLANEARALLTRLDKVRAYSLRMPMVPAAALSPNAQVAIERYLDSGCHKLREMVYEYIRWLQENKDQPISSPEAQRRFTILRMRFNNLLSQFDIFADVLNQRSEHDTGVWISGLDVVAADALKISGNYYEAPPVICYLDRGHGAAIRRARTRLPGGVKNPVAVIRVPRERMIGSGIASSLVHEVGHQGSALLDLVNSIRPILIGLQKSGDNQRNAWVFWERWISEVIADFWSVSKLGIASTLGLIGVVSLPRAFVFRITFDDPHPFPWMRVELSSAIGNVLYPHPQWERLSDMWQSLYPIRGLAEEKIRIISMLMDSMPAFVALLVNHRPRSLGGKSLMEVFRLKERQPSLLQAYSGYWRSSPQEMYNAQPSLVFAVIGQAKADGKITPEEESGILTNMLKKWALKSTLDISAICAKQSYAREITENKLVTV